MINADGAEGSTTETITSSSTKGGSVVDFIAYKAKKEHQEFLSWARRWSMITGNTDFSDPDFWEEVEEIMRESYVDNQPY